MQEKIAVFLYNRNNLNHKMFYWNMGEFAQCSAPKLGGVLKVIALAHLHNIKKEY